MVWKRDLYVHFKVLDRSCYFLSPSEIQNRCQRRSKFALKPYKPQINSMQTNNYALVDHMRTLTDFKSDTTIITDLNSISIRNTCEYGIIVLPLSVDQSKKRSLTGLVTF
jgi:hypothetical protein